MNYYYVGQKVSHQAFGDGEVIKIDDILESPIFVKFSSGVIRFYKDGKYLDSDEFPSLSQQPHVPLKLKLKETFKKHERVWVKGIVNQTWQCCYYCRQSGEKHYVFFGQETSGGTWDVLEIRKFSDIPF